jgi:ERCC4-type nuclease
MLVIDSREKSKLAELVEQEAKRLHVITEKRFLQIGDYVCGDVCFEAKSTTDFLGSVMSKRLWTQIDNMDRHYTTNVIIIYGTIDEAILSIIENSPNNMPVKARAVMLQNKFMAAIGRITLDMDAKPFWVSNVEQASEIIASVAKMQPKERKVIQPEVFKRVTTDDLRVDMLTSIKGVSSKKAKDMIKQFGSLMEIGECSAFELQAIDGIGKTLAERIITTLNSEEKVKI